MNPTKYKFDYYYQVEVLRLCVQDPIFLKAYPGVIQSNYFSTDALITISRLVLDFFNTYMEIPNYAIIKQQLADYCIKYSVPPESKGFLENLIDNIYTQALSNAKAITDTVCRFAREQSIKRAMQESLAVLESGGDLDEVTQKMLTASIVGTKQRESWSFFDKVKELPGMLEKDKAYSLKDRIPTPFMAFNKATFGGPGPGQIWVVGAKPKMGKTTLMINFAHFALLNGKCVYHYSFGDMNKMDVMMRYSSLLAKRTTDEIQVSTDYISLCESLHRSCNGADLQIIYESPFVMDADDIYTDLSWRVAKTGRKPDFIIVDYANKLKFKHSDNSNRSMSIIYGGLKGMGDSFDCPIMTGVQLRRGGVTGKGKDPRSVDGNAEDVSDSWLQIADCDAFMMINQTKEEEDQNVARLDMPVVRRGQAVYNLKVSYVKKYFKFKDIKQS